MITLNIISPELKKELKIKSIYKHLKHLYGWIIFCMAIYVLIFVAGKILLNVYLGKTTRETTLLTKNTQDYNERVKIINSELTDMDAIQKNTVYWSYFLEFIGQVTDKDLIINNITINKDAGTINFSGYASTRTNLLDFKASLENSGYFNEIDFPINNLLAQSNINFTINTTFKTYEFE